MHFRKQWVIDLQGFRISCGTKQFSPVQVLFLVSLYFSIFFHCELTSWLISLWGYSGFWIHHQMLHEFGMLFIIHGWGERVGCEKRLPQLTCQCESKLNIQKFLVILNHWKAIPFRFKSPKPILNLTFLESGWAAWSGPFSRTENWLFMFVQKKEPPKSQVQFLSSLNWSLIHPICFGKPTNDFDCGWFYHVLPQYCWWISTCFMFKILISIFYWLSF